MNNFQYSRGHLVFSDDDGNAVFENGTPFTENHSCAKCLLPCKENEPDPCIGWLDGVDFACCGHGIAGEAYVQAGGVTYESVEEWRGAHMG